MWHVRPTVRVGLLSEIASGRVMMTWAAEHDGQSATDGFDK